MEDQRGATGELHGTCTEVEFLRHQLKNSVFPHRLDAPQLQDSSSSTWHAGQGSDRAIKGSLQIPQWLDDAVNIH